MRRARYNVGLNDFEYCASLHIFHLTLDPDVITQSLQISPDRVHRPGDPRQTPKGRPLQGSYPSSYWHVELWPENGDSISDFLSGVVAKLKRANELLQRITSDDGTIECYIGIFTTRLCDYTLPADLLLQLGKLGIDLRLDFYTAMDEADASIS
jgi:hypothetical protein